jgi:hypothetical protein
MSHPKFDKEITALLVIDPYNDFISEDAPYSQNLFVYILQHSSREEAKKNWAASQADPEWKKVKADSEINGALAKHIDSYFMDPTSFSALK